MEKEARVCTGCYDYINKGKKVFLVIAVIIKGRIGTASISVNLCSFGGATLIGVCFPISDVEGRRE